MTSLYVLRPLGLVFIVMMLWGFSTKPDLPPAWVIVDTNNEEAVFTLLR